MKWYFKVQVYLFFAWMKTNFKFAVRYYFKRGFILGKKNIPQNTPVIFAANHPNSFMDAFVVGFITRKSINTLTRGDVFQKPLARYFLSLFRLLPVFRGEEGKGNLGKNGKTFERCVELFRKNHNVLIFSEGVSTQQKRLRRLRKGTARIAFQAYEELRKDIQIVPVGINYTYPSAPEGELLLKFGKPIKVSDYFDDYVSNNARAINALTKDLQQRIENQMIIIQEKEHEVLVETVFRIIRNELPNHRFKWMNTDEERFKIERDAAVQIHNLSTENTGVFGELSETIEAYISLLKKNRISDYGLSSGKLNVNITGFGLLLGLPLFVIGYLLSIVPRIMGDRIAKKTTRKAVEFYSAVNISIRMIIFALVHISILIMSLMFDWRIALFNLFAIPAISYFAIHYEIALKYWLRARRVKSIQKRDPELFQKLVTLRSRIMSILGIKF
ncbi:MAG: 1-acyl-sn-glycerol-3-phosphate acyltransferase [Flavobacteriales bacterium]|nr:1-acyl-sn-glycerol-3-phosphate acyltransferase [Flavobacteriales bacterium]